MTIRRLSSTTSCNKGRHKYAQRSHCGTILCLTIISFAIRFCLVEYDGRVDAFLTETMNHRHRPVKGYIFSYWDGGKCNDWKSMPTPNLISTSTTLQMAMKVNIRIVGRKSSEPWLEEGVDMYERRLQPSNIDVETTWHKDDSALLKGIDTDRQKQHKIVCLDPNGKSTTSENFSKKLYDWLEEGGSRLSFVIGGANGLPSELKYPSFTPASRSKTSDKSSKPTMISLSQLTFTHQFARLLLIEQIYRATEIRKGTGYHK